MKSLFRKKIVVVACALTLVCTMLANPIYAEESTSTDSTTTSDTTNSTPTPTVIADVETTPTVAPTTTPTTTPTTAPVSSSAPITITPPNSIIQPVNGVYTSSFGVSSEYDIEDMRFASGKLGMDGYDSAQVVSTTSFDIPASESDQWYTFYVKDVNGNMSFVNFYAHCDDKDEVDDSKTTPTPTTTPTTPTTTTTPTNGSTSGGSTSTPVTTATTTSLVPTPKAVSGNCLDTQTIDANGNCVDKVTELPQTGGFDTLMLFFLFGCGLGLCGIGVLAYAKVKVKK